MARKVIQALVTEDEAKQVRRLARMRGTSVSEVTGEYLTKGLSYDQPLLDEPTEEEGELVAHIMHETGIECPDRALGLLRLTSTALANYPKSRASSQAEAVA